jgi:hypothetical protein
MCRPDGLAAYREAVIEYAQGWVRWLVKGALKVARDVGRGGGMARERHKDAPRPPLSGRILRYA